jgi:hypothetical protein
MAITPSFEGKSHAHFYRNQSPDAHSDLEVMSCEAALFEWAESYDTKVCVFPSALIFLFKYKTNTDRTGNASVNVLHQP